MERYVPVARVALTEAAREKATTLTYGELMPSLGGRGYIGQVLDELNRREHEQGRPLLSALVVRADTGMPSRGFFGLARELRPSSTTDDRALWERELASVRAFDWSN